MDKQLEHTLNTNSIKMYDKQAAILRIETTINQTRDFRVYREARIGLHGRARDTPPPSWRDHPNGKSLLTCDVSSSEIGLSLSGGFPVPAKHRCQMANRQFALEGR